MIPPSDIKCIERFKHQDGFSSPIPQPTANRNFSFMHGPVENSRTKILSMQSMNNSKSLGISVKIYARFCVHTFHEKNAHNSQIAKGIKNSHYSIRDLSMVEVRITEVVNVP